MPCPIKGLAYMFFVHRYFKWIVNIVPVYKQAYGPLLESRHSCTYMHKLRVKCHSHEFFDCLDHEIFKLGNFCLSYIRAHHSGKFAPSETNPLYSIQIQAIKSSYTRIVLHGQTTFLMVVGKGSGTVYKCF